MPRPFCARKVESTCFKDVNTQQIPASSPRWRLCLTVRSSRRTTTLLRDAVQKRLGRRKPQLVAFFNGPVTRAHQAQHARHRRCAVKLEQYRCVCETDRVPYDSRCDRRRRRDCACVARKDTSTRCTCKAETRSDPHVQRYELQTPAMTVNRSTATTHRLTPPNLVHSNGAHRRKTAKKGRQCLQIQDLMYQYLSLQASVCMMGFYRAVDLVRLGPQCSLRAHVEQFKCSYGSLFDTSSLL
jgi:hypothetical protein